MLALIECDAMVLERKLREESAAMVNQRTGVGGGLNIIRRAMPSY
jgi:hypothetical protein